MAHLQRALFLPPLVRSLQLDCLAEPMVSFGPSHESSSPPSERTPVFLLLQIDAKVSSLAPGPLHSLCLSQHSAQLTQTPLLAHVHLFQQKQAAPL